MKRCGFSLIEVLVAVIIVSVLVSLGVGSYTAQKKQAEYNGMIATVRSLGAVVKNIYYVRNSFLDVPNTGNTAATNAQYQMGIVDGNFYDYEVRRPGASGHPVTIHVKYHPRHATGGGGPGGVNYVFDLDGQEA